MNEFPGYEAAHEETIRLYSRSLPEHYRRCYAALETLKIGFGDVACGPGLGDEPAHLLNPWFAAFDSSVRGEASLD